jgi:2-methylcitrate dehydratase PrpD
VTGGPPEERGGTAGPGPFTAASTPSAEAVAPAGRGVRSGLQPGGVPGELDDRPDGDGHPDGDDPLAGLIAAATGRRTFAPSEPHERCDPSVPYGRYQPRGRYQPYEPSERRGQREQHARSERSERSAAPALAELAALQSAESLRHAALLAADTVGVMLAGGRRPEAVALAAGEPGDELSVGWAHLEPRPGAAARLLTAGGGFAEPDRAAYVNATAACALELDEGTRPTGHPAVHVLPAALAAAEALGCRWSDMLSAFTAGYEVAAGLFERYALRAPTHPHGHLGGAGAAVAVALLAGDDPLAAARAALTVPLLTTWPPCLEGAGARNTWAGHAAATGLLARRLVRSGHRGATTALTAAFDGLVADRLPRSASAGATAPYETPDGPAGTPGFRIRGGYLKLYSACALTHSAIQAALRLAPLDRELPPPPGPASSASPVEQVSSIDVEVNANSLKVAAQPAGNALSRRFSLPYAVAVALLHGDAEPHRFDAPDPDALALARRVTVGERPEFTAEWPGYAPARVTVRLDDGRIRTARVRDADGHPGSPVGTAAVAAKFRALTGLSGREWELLSSGGGELLTGEVLDAVTGRTPAAGTNPADRAR